MKTNMDTVNGLIKGGDTIKALHALKTMKGDRARFLEATLLSQALDDIRCLVSLNAISENKKDDSYWLLRAYSCVNLGLVGETQECLKKISTISSSFTKILVRNAMFMTDTAVLNSIVDSTVESESLDTKLLKLLIYSAYGDEIKLLSEAEAVVAIYPEVPSPWIHIHEQRGLSHDEDKFIMNLIGSCKNLENKIIFLNLLGKSLIAKDSLLQGVSRIVQANEIAKSQKNYDFAYQEKQFEKIRRLMSNLDACESGGNYFPIFIIGMPRSGTTLLEKKLLDAGYDSVGESLLISNLLKINLIKTGEISAEFIKQKYLENISLRGIKRGVWVDKSLNNYKYLPLIRVMFPKARFMLVNREKQANFWSIYKTIFQSGNNFSYSFESISAESRLMEKYLSLVDENDYMKIKYEEIVAGKLKIEPIDEGIIRPLNTASAGLVRKRVMKDRDEEIVRIKPILDQLRIRIIH